MKQFAIFLKDWAEPMSAIVQSVAVVIGVIFALNEFVLRDKEFDSQILEVTLALTDGLREPRVIEAQKRLHELGTPLENIRGAAGFSTNIDELVHYREALVTEFDAQTRDLAHFYRVIDQCLIARGCNRELTESILCTDVLRDSRWVREIVDEFGSTPPYTGRGVIPGGFFESLMHLRESCLLVENQGGA